MISKGKSFNDRLVNDGHAATVLRQFDAAFDNGVAFRPGEMLDAFEVAPIIVALRQAGREGDAAAILTRLQRQIDRDVGVRPRAASLPPQRAIVAALAGKREEAMTFLTRIAAHDPYRLIRLPFNAVSDQPALRWLAADPRMPAIDRAVRNFVDGERRKLGWPPLGTEKTLQHPI